MLYIVTITRYLSVLFQRKRVLLTVVPYGCYYRCQILTVLYYGVITAIYVHAVSTLGHYPIVVTACFDDEPEING